MTLEYRRRFPVDPATKMLLMMRSQQAIPRSQGLLEAAAPNRLFGIAAAAASLPASIPSGHYAVPTVPESEPIRLIN